MRESLFVIPEKAGIQMRIMQIHYFSKPMEIRKVCSPALSTEPVAFSFFVVS
jgi:hypothetical protein